MTDALKRETGVSPVDKLMECQTFGEIKTAIAAFIKTVRKTGGKDNGMHAWVLCQQLTQALTARAKPYTTAPRSSKTNTVIVPPGHAPLMLLKLSIPFNGYPEDILNALQRFMSRCDEYEAPICDAITEAEIKRVLNAAQKAYRLFDIIAPEKPLKILRFDNSHMVYNSHCGFPSDDTFPPTIMVYHPRETEVYDRVFIFAHELGHALHHALTGNVSITPDGFDQLNDIYAPKMDKAEDMQERFADAVALAILNIKGFGKHFPTQISKTISPNFARYLRGQCEKKLKSMGVYSEPLPPVNQLWQAGLNPAALSAESR